jgi:hypothetical protein
MIGRRWPAKRP